MKINLNTEKEKLNELKAGDLVKLSGTFYTARDAAHMRLLSMIQNEEPLPADFFGSVIYYAGPTPAKPGRVIGSIGPTTSSRMDGFASMMKELHVVGTIGKGPRSEQCEKEYAENGILYFVATGGCGALLAHSIVQAEVIAFPDLGPESIKKLTVKDFPAIVALDAKGHSIFKK